MAPRRSILIVAAVVPLLLGSCQTASLTPVSTEPAPSLGSLEHRGRRYDLRDLNSQAYRDASADPFVRNFNPDLLWARKDALQRFDRIPVSATIEDTRR